MSSIILAKRVSATAFLAVMFLFPADLSQALDRTWIGGNIDWADGGTAANWSPADEPDADDTAIFNTANTVNLGSNNTVLGLTMSGGISLGTNTYDLTVDGLLALSGTGTDLTISGSGSQVQADSATLGGGGMIVVADGTLSVIEETGYGTLQINSDGQLRGRGTVSFGDGLTSAATLMVNDGTISAAAPVFILGGTPTPGTLAINANDPGDARLDLDGLNPLTTTVNVFRNQTLDINMPLLDPYGGDLNLYQNSTLDLSAPWSIDASSTIDIDNGFIDNSGTIFPNVPAGIAHIAGAAFTQAGGTITVIDGDGTLQFDARFTLSSGNLVNNGELVFTSSADITAGANLTMPGSTASLTVGPGAGVGIHQANFNADGGGFPTNVLTVGSAALLELWLGTGADETLNGTTVLNGGELYVNTADNTWSIAGPLQVGAGTTGSRLSGETLTLAGPITVGNGSNLLVDADNVWASSCSLGIGTGSTVTVVGSSTFSGPSSLAGAGTLRLNSATNISANTTVSVGTLDWDGSTIGGLHTIGDGVVFTVNSALSDDMDDPVTIGGNGASLVMNGGDWVMRNTLTTNNPATGQAVLGGSSLMELSGNDFKVNGNTLITSPVRFGVYSSTTVASGARLDVDSLTVRYNLCSINGGGYFDPPGVTNVVEGNSVVSTTSFNFDAGNWQVNDGATFEVLVGDYDPDVTVKGFDTTIILAGGSTYVTSSFPQFVMDGTLVMNSTDGGNQATWDGEPLHVGNDAGILDSHLDVTGTGTSRIASDVTFMSDADVSVAAGSTLVLGSTATFNSMGTGVTQFAGQGTLVTNGTVFFNEEATLGMAGGVVDLDGNDLTGATIHVDAPVTIWAGSLQGFGKTNTVGTNILEVDHLNAGKSGLLEVKLDDPAGQWVLNGPGVLRLMNDASPATLLAGSAARLEGTVDVTGDVRSDARLEIVGTVNLLTAGEPLRLGGGDVAFDMNRIAGGVVNGPGRLSADFASALAGYGTINADIEFATFSDLLAEAGTLHINGSILDAWTVGTRGGVLNVANPWSSAGVDYVDLSGGQLTGGTLTIANTQGVTGNGWLRSRVINNTVIDADSLFGGTLRVETAAHDNDWDGAGGTGVLRATGGTLECHDNAQTAFIGTVEATGGGTVYASGFAFDFNPGSAINLTNGTYKAGKGTTIGGTVNIGAGPDSTIQTESASLLRFESGSATTLSGTLGLRTANGNIQAGATFSGVGALVIPPGYSVSADNGADINVLIDNDGLLSLAGPGVGRVDAKDFQQSSTGDLLVGLQGIALNAFDRLVVDGAAQVAGDLVLTLGGGYVPAVGDTFNVISATGGVTGSFNSLAQPAGMPAGTEFKVNYTASLVQLEVVTAGSYDDWINSFAGLSDPADRARSANPDGDGFDNFGEFALDGDPTSGASSGKIVGKVAPVAGVDALTLTFPVRVGAVPAAGDPAGGPLVLEQTVDGVIYSVQAGDGLSSFTLDVSEVIGADAVAIQVGLPTPSSGWSYRTFRGPASVSSTPQEFMRVGIAESP